MKGRQERGQRGFTLIELLAVMAILAVLAAMVAPAISGTKEASVDAKVLSDATQVRSATTDYFKDRTGSEVRTPHSILTATLVSKTTGVTKANATLSANLGTVGTPDDPATASVDELAKVQQVVSDRWPELYITAGTGLPNIFRTDGFAASSVYPAIFNTATDPVVKEVVLLGSDGKTFAGASLINRFTAIDLELLKNRNYLASIPDSARAQTATDSTQIDNFLWLFEKKSSVGGSDDDRTVAVFKLIKVEKLEGVNQTTGTLAQKVRLTYERVF